MIEGKLQDILSFTVQVRKNDLDTIVGTAFAVDKNDGLLVTCKHVIELALDSPNLFRDSEKVKSAKVWVYFRQDLLSDSDKVCPAHIIRYFPEHDDDVVILQLEKPPLPSEVKVAILGNAEESIGHEFQSFGYRRLENYQGLPAAGKILNFGDKPRNRILYSNPVVLTSQQIDSGMSGSAVLDKERNLVVGVISETWDSGSQHEDRDTAFAVDCAIFQVNPFNLPVQDKPFPLNPNPKLKIDKESTSIITKLNPALNNIPAYNKEWVERDELLQVIGNRWVTKDCHIVGLIGFGGEGKSSLARRWLDIVLKDQLSSPDGVFWWSFNEQPNVDEFFDSALRYTTGGFIDPCMMPSTKKKIETIGYSFGKRLLFVLDGLETIQKQDGDHYGSLVSANLRNFLVKFAARGSNSFCLITSRVPILDLMSYNSYTECDVGRLSAIEGCTLLRNLGVKGADFALDQVVTDWDGHALTLTLIATFLFEHYNGDITYINKIPLPTANEPHYQRVARILQQYDLHMSKAERLFLMIFSAFRRPLEKTAFDKVFRNKNDKDPLNKAIASLNDTNFKALVKQLVNYRILQVDQSRGNCTFHSLIRRYYYERLKHSGLIKLAHKRIGKYYLQSYQGTYSYTIDDLTPLIEAVYHSCRAGKYEDGYKIYLDKIDKKQGTLLYQLGAYETDLALMCEFFPKGDFLQDPLIKNTQDKAYLIRSLGLCLMTVGRLQEALSMYDRSYKISLKIKDFFNAGKTSQLLSELYIHLGNLSFSINCANQAIEHYRNAKDSWGKSCSLGHEMWGVQNEAMGTPQLTICCLGYKAWAMHLRGDQQKASAMFKHAEELARKNNPKMRYLRDLWGIYHADYLIFTGDIEYAKQITKENLKYAQDNHLTEIISQCHRILGDIDAKLELKSAKEHYDEALKIARNITHRAVLIEALLGRGRWNTRQENLKEARSDLEEALSYSLAAGYRIYEKYINMTLDLCS